MPPRTRAGVHSQKQKERCGLCCLPASKHRANEEASGSRAIQLANSYNELLEEFSSKDLRSVGNYSLGRLIGKGSFGKVYLATHKLTNGSKVVLKSSSKEDTNLAREIHHHRQFLHPHIARLYEVVVTENLVWLVLEYCPGDELYNYLVRHGPLPVEKVKRIFTQLVGAVAYVHKRERETMRFRVYARVRRQGELSPDILWDDMLQCTGNAEGGEIRGGEVDVWSLGIILYALLAGELPYDDDDDQVTKKRILSEDPTYNDKFTEEAKSLINLLLSKRPLIRPSLEDILAHPFLSEHAPEQLAILKIPSPSPFTTPLEKTTLQRMKSAGVNIDEVIENVLAQRCDPLAGWWALLIEKEQRKEKKRERKRKEREAEAKTIRRLSAASSRMERLSTALMEVDEEGHANSDSQLHERGRRDRRSLPSQLAVPELPALPEPVPGTSPDNSAPPTPLDKVSVRSATSLRKRPVPPPKDKRRSRPSMLHVSASQPELAQHHGIFRRRTTRRHNPIISQLASLKHWFVESAKRARSPNAKSSGTRKFTEKFSPSKSQDSGRKSAALSPQVQTPTELTTPTQIKRISNASSLAPSSASYRQNRHSYPRQPRQLNTSHSSNRNSLSPSPITPRGSYRRSSVGLRGRKSTSSSVSSIRSIHHTRAHSKASSVSSNSMDTIHTPTARISRSPHSSIKVLPTTPGASSRFPSNIRLVRGPGGPSRDIGTGAVQTQPPPSAFNEAAPGPMLFSPSSSLVFARRKRSAFKGPMGPTVQTVNLMGSGGPVYSPVSGPTAEAGEPSLKPERAVARKSQIIEEEEDDEFLEEEIEEVDEFDGPEDPGELELAVPIADPLEDLAEGPEATEKVEAETEADSGSVRKFGLDPAPELTSTPIRPPRSSSPARPSCPSHGRNYRSGWNRRGSRSRRKNQI
ncbi:hypothetical protein N7468_010705 [Penicillium chermesinum]|uniref:Protein kinase domain-containing protein n=1 Tax=Penicillium chermesinum TaxID=63820 RepID=A0A9W9N899_9EURO|nr:uncharacterized protein N7468_010705 [Penicillium chermesinum]KAJ5215026.1 hypothetical protein N7468_010705 [Penicillium chermesinum]